MIVHVLGVNSLEFVLGHGFNWVQLLIQLARHLEVGLGIQHLEVTSCIQHLERLVPNLLDWMMAGKTALAHRFNVMLTLLLMVRSRRFCGRYSQNVTYIET